MSERPRAGSSIPPRGDEATEGSEQKKRGESDPLFNPPGLKRRSTFMGLAPAPHLGGLAGSPGSLARADEEARRQQRVRERLDKTVTGPPAPMMGNETSQPPSPSMHPREELIEPLPTGHTRPPAGGSPHAPAQPGASVSPGAMAAPAFGTTTMLMYPRTPNIPLTLPQPADAQEPPPKLPSSDGWDVVQPAKEESNPGFPSSPTVLVEPSHSVTGPPPPGAQYGPPPHAAASHAPPPYRGPAYGHAAPYGAHVPDAETAPNTERMLRPVPVSATPPAMQPDQGAAGLVVRRWEPEPPPAVLPPPEDKRLVLLAEPDSTAADAYRVLRDQLIAKNLPRVIAVSSPQQRDGKTTCAINLALALSEQPSTRVLLVDGNFFDPELARVFGMEKLPMLSPPEAEMWLPPYRLAQVMPSLHLVGILPNEMPRRRFEQHRFEALIDRLCRANYDYIIIDAPALQGSPAVVQLLAVADATLLAVRAGGGTTARELRRAAEQIPKDKALGVTLIDG